MKEAEAIACLKRGNIDGLEVLVRLHQQQALRTAYLITRDKAAAEDVVQTAFIRVYKQIDQFDSGRPVIPWFLRIVANRAIRITTRDGQTIPIESHEHHRDWLAQIPSDTQSPDMFVENADTAEQLWIILEQLSPEQRAVIVLRYYAGLKNVEIARDLSIPPSTARWRLHMALRRLRAMLALDGWVSDQEAETGEKRKVVS